jgi:hypothetical protein
MIAAPALAAAMDSSAISLGVIGRCGVIVGVWIEPVTAQVIITFLFACATSQSSSLRHTLEMVMNTGDDYW